MVSLDKVYTRGGDEGKTSLGDGTRVPKTDERIEAYGTVDELNAFVAACLEHAPEPTERERLIRIQHDLFDLGADLCVPCRADEERGAALRLAKESVARLETWIDDVNEALEPLKSFVLPGGTSRASALHVARVVCRRAERCVLRLADREPERVSPAGRIYLNRLSDLLFVMARAAAGEQELLWKPRGGADS